MSMLIQTAAKPEKPGHPRPTSQQKNRLTAILTIVIVLVAAIAFAIVYTNQNKAIAAELTGKWYCVEEDIQYTFGADGTFSTSNGQQTLLSGTWNGGWLKNTLELKFESEGIKYDKKTNYIFSDDFNQVKLTDINENGLTMKRLKDS